MANDKKLDCVILGLLSHEDLTGYEIKKKIDTALTFFWHASFGSIYPTLKELVNKGFAVKSDKKENSRNQIKYAITNQGRNHLKKWLEIPENRDELRYETLLKLFFSDDAGKQTALKHIENFEKKITKELPLLISAVKNLENAVKQNQAHLYYLLTAKLGLNVYETYLDWCQESKGVLEEAEERMINHNGSGAETNLSNKNIKTTSSGLKIILRKEIPADSREVNDLIDKAFAAIDEFDVTDYYIEVRKKDTYIPDLSFVAVLENGKIVGQIALYKTDIIMETGRITQLVLSPISVLPDYFRKGIAREIITFALKKAKEMGYTAVFLQGNPLFYKKFGFEPAYKYGIFHKTDPGKNAEHCMVHVLIPGGLDGITGTTYYE